MAAPDNPWITGLDTVRKHAPTPGVVELYEPPPEKGSAGCLVIIAFLLFVFWLYNRSFETAIGWLWLLLSGAAAYVVATREYSRTSLTIEPGLLRITTGFARFPHRYSIPPAHLSEIRVLVTRHSRQSTSSNTWYQSHRYQLALVTRAGRIIQIFHQLTQEDQARQAAEQLAVLISAEPTLPIAWQQPPPRLSFRTAIGILAAATIIFFLIARAC